MMKGRYSHQYIILISLPPADGLSEYIGSSQIIQYHTFRRSRTAGSIQIIGCFSIQLIAAFRMIETLCSQSLINKYILPTGYRRFANHQIRQTIRQ